jgi:hypothetical protein
MSLNDIITGPASRHRRPGFDQAVKACRENTEEAIRGGKIMAAGSSSTGQCCLPTWSAWAVRPTFRFVRAA